MLLRYHIGAIANYDINEAISLQSSLLFSIKGANANFSEQDDFFEFSQKSYSSLYYLNVPIHVAYKISNFQIYAGPYVGFGIGGRSKVDITTNFDLGGQFSEKTQTIKGKNTPFYKEIKTNDQLELNESPYNGFDYGLNVGLGYKVNNLLFNVGYSYGLGNLIVRTERDNDFRKDNKIQNRAISFSVSYFFGE